MADQVDLDAFIEEGLKAIAENPENRDRALLTLLYQVQRLNGALAPLLAMISNPGLMKNAERMAGMFGR